MAWCVSAIKRPSVLWQNSNPFHKEQRRFSPWLDNPYSFSTSLCCSFLHVITGGFPLDSSHNAYFLYPRALRPWLLNITSNSCIISPRVGWEGRGDKTHYLLIYLFIPTVIRAHFRNGHEEEEEEEKRKKYRIYLSKGTEVVANRRSQRV